MHDEELSTRYAAILLALCGLFALLFLGVVFLIDHDNPDPLYNTDPRYIQREIPAQEALDVTPLRPEPIRRLPPPKTPDSTPPPPPATRTSEGP